MAQAPGDESIRAEGEILSHQLQFDMEAATVNLFLQW